MTKGNYYALSGKYFNSAALDGLPYYFNEAQWKELLQKLRPEIKELYFWTYLDGQVSNGGFEQFFDNGYTYMIPEIFNFYARVGDTLSIELLKKAEKWSIENGDEEVFFDENLTILNRAYFAHSEMSNQLIEGYVRANSNLYFQNEEGHFSPANYTGKVASTNPITNERREFKVLNNQVHGLMTLFAPNEKISKELNYEKGTLLGMQKVYDEDGRLEKQEVIDVNPRKTEISYFYPNGQRQTSFTEDSTKTIFGEVSYWHENGALKWSYLLDNEGRHTDSYMEYYSDGKVKLEVDSREERPRFINFWDTDGNQLLQDGTGLYVDEYQIGKNRYRQESHFKNFLEDGVQRSFTNGILRSYKEMTAGELDGYSRKYYSNGKLEEEYLIKDGKVITQTANPLFENPKLNVKIETSVNETLLLQRGYSLSESYPKLINEEDALNYISIPTDQFEPYGWDEKFWGSYLLHITESGAVEGFDFFTSRNGYVSKAIEEIFPKLKFQPGLINDKPVPSYLFFKMNLWLIESED